MIQVPRTPAVTRQIDRQIVDFLAYVFLSHGDHPSSSSPASSCERPSPKNPWNETSLLLLAFPLVPHACASSTFYAWTSPPLLG